MIRPSLLGLFFLLISSVSVQAQVTPLWLRYPTLSPDGQTIVFSYKGDLYRVASEGGMAQQLTIHPGVDTMPVFSPDGQSIAFASNRHGNFDVFVMSVNGGASTRLTFHSGSDSPFDFSPDGEWVIFGASRSDVHTSSQFPSGRLPELYRVPVKGGRVEMVSSHPLDEARYHPLGKHIIYQDKKGGEDKWRKRHTSSITRDIIVYNIEEKTHTPLVTWKGEDRTPVYSADGNTVYYLSEEGGTFNVWKIGSEGAQKQRLTKFENHPVRFLSVSRDGLLCFTWNGEIYTMKEGQQPTKLALQLIRAEQANDVEIKRVNRGASQLAVSPSGKEVAFIYRGEVFATSVETNVTKRITNTPSQERSVSFSPDGKALLYAAERNNSWNLYQTKLVQDGERYFFNATVLAEEPVLESEAEAFQPAFSPDGKEVAFLEERTTLRVLNLESKEIRTIQPGNMSYSYGDGDQHYEWSPDGKWFFTSFSLPGYWPTEVGLVSSDGKGEIINLTESGYPDYQPRWMMGGKMLMWFSSRDGMKSHADSGSSQADVYGMYLTQKEWDRANLTKEEFDLLKEAEKEAKKKDKDKAKDKDKEGDDSDSSKKKKKKKSKKDKDKDKSDKDEADDKKEDKELFAIDIDGIRERKKRLTIHSASISDAVVTPDGETLLYLAAFERGFNLWQTKIRTRETKILAKLNSRGGSLTLDKEGKHVFLIAGGGSIKRIDVKSGKSKNISYSSEMNLDRDAERAYIFEHAWRQVTKKFYKPDLHGARWDFYKGEYARFLPHIGNGYDFADMLSELLGELNASHTGARHRPRGVDGDSTAALGLFYDEAHTGAGIKVAEVMPKSPVLKNDSQIKAGVIIEKIDGQDITATTNHLSLLNRKAGKYTLLSLHDPATDKRWQETVKPISLGQEYNLKYERWVENRRKKTDELSNGRIGYVHVRSMGDSSFRTVIEEVLGAQVTREALVVDTRFNGGGDLVENLSNFLNGRKYMDFVPPDGRSIGMEPSRRWSKPSIVIAGEGNYSDAHCFPWAYKELGIGKLVGMPVPGTCTFVWWEGQIDGETVFGIPNMGILTPQDTMLENLQLEMDIQVKNDPELEISGRDQQLEAAVADLLKQLDN